MHPARLARGPGTTMDISFSLRQDPLEQALFGEFLHVYLHTFFKVLLILMIFGVCQMQKII